MSRQGDYLADQAIRDQARFIANSQGITDQQFKASQGWLERFKVRAGISGGRVLEDDPHLDDERGFTEAAFPLPSPQEPLSSSSSSSTGSFFDESDTAMLHQAHRRSDSSVSLAPSSLSGSQASSYLASQSDAARRFPTQQMHDQFASQPGSTALAQYQHQDPNTPLTSPDYPITSRIHQRTQSGVPSQVDSSLISPPFSALSDQARPGHFDAQQRAFMSRRATISAFSAEPQQQQRLAFDPSCAPQPLHVTLPQAQQASSVLAQFIQQQQGLVPPDIHHVILSLQYFLHQQQSQTEQFQADQYNLNTGMPVELMAPMPHKPIDTSMVPLSEAMVSGTTSQQQQAYPLQTHQLHPPPQAF